MSIDLDHTDLTWIITDPVTSLSWAELKPTRIGLRPVFFALNDMSRLMDDLAGILLVKYDIIYVKGACFIEDDIFY